MSGRQGREKQRQTLNLPIHFPKVTEARAGAAEARSQNRHLGLWCRLALRQGGKELDWKWSSQDLPRVDVGDREVGFKSEVQV